MLVKPAPSAPDISRPQARLLLLIILSVTLFAYLASLRYDFVYDDRIMQLQNPLIRDWHNLPDYFTHDLWSHWPKLNSHYYRPALLIWYMAVYYTAGLEPTPWHFTTILVHLGLVAMVWLLARRILKQNWAAILATLIFALHPLHVETVTWVGGVNESWLGICLIGAYLAYRRSRERADHRVRWLAISLFSYAWALLFKETAVVFPLMIVADEFISEPASESWLRRLWKGTRYASIYLPQTMLYLAVRSWVLTRFMNESYEHHSALERLDTGMALTWFYLKHLVWPSRLSIMYDFDFVKHFSFAQVLLPGLLIAAGLFLAARYLGNPRAVAAALLWTLLPLAPAVAVAMILAPFGMVHDRYLCTSVLGVALLGGMALAKLLPRLQWKGVPVVAAALAVEIAGLSVAGIQRESAPYQNNIALFRRATEVAPKDQNSRNWLASELLQQGHSQESLAIAEQMIATHPELWAGNFDAGCAALVLNRLPEAEDHFKRAGEIFSENHMQHFYLGAVRMRMKKYAEAEPELRQAIYLSPQSPGYHLLLGDALQKQGKVEAARTAYRTELQDFPGSKTAQVATAALNASAARAR